MKFTLATVVALFGASAIAAPTPQDDGAPSENIDISNLSVRRQENGTVTHVSFNLSGDDAQGLLCSADTGVPSNVITCGDFKYSFSVQKGNETDYALSIYHTFAPGVGYWGQGDVLTYCHAGGLGDLLCDQVNPTTIVINSNPLAVNA
ncbi:hypothetical protein CGRA01v4_09573 [Colletotrichum graminicola]|uniref:AA1-like domain-containing protein n=1 Tax=Colletotrichum graminicola (strain M1.001 / M2 / FGSC 10212) TaxID=645133 RepID=E3QP13_COLGM|nr:uncharacterized protein GLRG_07615 [Colletotrichum graminicola M1.001]EFQ32601.1 hypothetical protein GLRG_07615 [Colletotrichum graminicola M1.001]WDK18288.1 hypothetical protein CGRA01v4_09573 [Colletotrichum graminicola]